ncbi:MAG: hypothetical protein A3G75_13000 [Verrucomicrobia bacterium RIFCSPLOWO2_12_FULL_64_8]|nr:MAG: hypothetical protein A3G75_13000 [Verrucomicrobia bacterium RIFCSPLOWO2_12_FULL_64_8]
MALGLGLAPLAAAEGGATAVGRDLINRYADALVNVNLVIALKAVVSGQTLPSREIKREVSATVISPDGLAVVSLVALDPGEILEGMRINTPKGPVRIESVTSEFKEVKMRKADGTEVAARVLLKDNDLDLAFICPVKDAAPGRFAWVDLSKEASPDLLATGYVLTRAGRGLQGTPLVRRSDILGIVEKPRRILVIEYTAPGNPMFDEKGRVYGFCARHMVNGRLAGNVVLSPSDVAEMAEQAEAAREAADASPAPAAPPETAPAPPEPAPAPSVEETAAPPAK